jgi:hypothetical protein
LSLAVVSHFGECRRILWRPWEKTETESIGFLGSALVVPYLLALVPPTSAISIIMTEGKPMTKVLIYGGKTGWIGGMMYEMLQKEGAF